MSPEFWHHARSDRPGFYLRNRRLLWTMLRLWALGLGDRVEVPRQPLHATRLMGLDISNPIGLAAGIDRNGRLLTGVERAGYGFREVGSVTPRTLAISERQLRCCRPPGQGLVTGVNIRPTSATAAGMIDDYLHCLRRLLSVADYLVLNLGSPHSSPVQRGWASDPGWLESLLTQAVAARDQYQQDRGRRVPLAIKLSLGPRLSGDHRQGLALCGRAGLDGLVLVAAPGQPELVVCHTLRQVKNMIGEMTLISVGGIGDADQVTGRLVAGATAIQLFSAVLRLGPFIPGRWLEQLHSKPPPDLHPKLQGEAAR